MSYYYNQLVEEHGEEKANEHMRTIAPLGGSKKNKLKGYGSNRKLAAESGRKSKPNGRKEDADAQTNDI